MAASNKRQRANHEGEGAMFSGHDGFTGNSGMTFTEGMSERQTS